MKKRLAMLGISIAVLAVLVGVYMYMSKNGNTETENTVSQVQDFEDLGKRLTFDENVKKFSLNNSNGSFNFVKKSDKWYISGMDNTLDQSAVSSIAYVFSSLYAEQTVEEDPQDLTVYGLDNPGATASCNGVEVRLGKLTADNKYFYVQAGEDKAVYIAETSLCDSLNYGLNDFIDKSVVKIDSNTIQELEIKRKDKDDILVKYDKDNPIAREYAEKNGLATLVMTEPVENMLVYPYSLQTSVLKNLSNLNVKDLVEANPEDLSKYGLDNPALQVRIRDRENTVIFKAGNNAPTVNDTEYIYVMINDRPEVFTMDYRSAEPFINASIADFTEKFISLYQRSKVESVEIKSGDDKYTVDFKSEGENTYKEIDGVTKDYRNTYINGTLVDKDTFTSFYEQLVSIGFDHIDMQAKAEGEAKVVITFELKDGSSDIAEYYDYNRDFYVVKKGDNASMLVNKQTVAKVINEAAGLCK